MTAYILRRLVQGLVTVAALSLAVFFGVHVVGDPVWLLVNPNMDQRDVEAAVRTLGLDRPIWEQYLYFLSGVLRGDLGRSFIFGEPALGLIVQRMPATIELAFAALAIAIATGLPLGLYAGLNPDRVSSKAIMAASVLGFSLPTFWVGLMLMMVFAVMLGWLPSTGRGATASFLGITSSLLTLDGLRHILLPALNLSLLKIALVIRLTQAGASEVLHKDYIRFARAKGLARARIIRVHLLRNILIPVVTVLGLELGNLIAFSVVTETIFAWPGMGKLLIDAIQTLDRPVIVAYLIIVGLTFVLINIVVDLLYSMLDPRVRPGGASR
jgi:peptide/nickel transport system permease protein